MEIYYALFTDSNDGIIINTIPHFIKIIINCFLIYFVMITLYNTTKGDLADNVLRFVKIAILLMVIFATPGYVYPEGELKISKQKNGLDEYRYCVEKVTKNEREDQLYSWNTIYCLDNEEEALSMYDSLTKKREETIELERLRRLEEYKLLVNKAKERAKERYIEVENNL